MSPDDTTYTLIVPKALKAKLELVPKLDGRKSMNHWFWTYIGPIMENLVDQQIEYYKTQPERPTWKIELPKKKKGKGGD